MFNFDVFWIGHGMITDAVRATTCRRNCKAHAYKKSIENGGPSENMGFNGETDWRFRTIKRIETLFSTFQKNPVEHKDPKPSIEPGPGRQ